MEDYLESVEDSEAVESLLSDRADLALLPLLLLVLDALGFTGLRFLEEAFLGGLGDNPPARALGLELFFPPFTMSAHGVEDQNSVVVPVC